MMGKGKTRGGLLCSVNCRKTATLFLVLSWWSASQPARELVSRSLNSSILLPPAAPACFIPLCFLFLCSQKHFSCRVGEFNYVKKWNALLAMQRKSERGGGNDINHCCWMTLWQCTVSFGVPYDDDDDGEINIPSQVLTFISLRKSRELGIFPMITTEIKQVGVE